MDIPGFFAQPDAGSLQYILRQDPTEEGALSTVPQISDLWRNAEVEFVGLDPDLRQLFQVLISESRVSIEKSPTPANLHYSVSTDDIQIAFRSTRVPLGLSATLLMALMTAAAIGLPWPYDLAAVVAFGGPLAVSAYGLLTQPN